jgi:hypothetical protein
MRGGWISAREFQLHVSVEDLGVGGATRVPVGGAQKLVQVTKVGHHTGAFLSNRRRAPAMFITGLRLHVIVPWL